MPPRKQRADRDLEKASPRRQFVEKLRRLADALDSRCVRVMSVERRVIEFFLPATLRAGLDAAFAIDLARKAHRLACRASSRGGVTATLAHRYRQTAERSRANRVIRGLLTGGATPLVWRSVLVGRCQVIGLVCLRLCLMIVENRKTGPAGPKPRDRCLAAGIQGPCL